MVLGGQGPTEGSLLQSLQPGGASAPAPGRLRTWGDSDSNFFSEPVKHITKMEKLMSLLKESVNTYNANHAFQCLPGIPYRLDYKTEFLHLLLLSQEISARGQR